jgi:POT family proton-dependent oligopeptide transporter
MTQDSTTVGGGALETKGAAAAASGPALTSEDEANRFPPGIPFIVGNEGAERFSYYGMRAVLYVYLASLYVQLGLGDGAEASARATQVAHLFFAGVYAFPMIGAILADRLLGKYPVILWVSLLYCVGHGILAIAGRFDAAGNYGAAEIGMYAGLVCIAIGSGGIKPCVSANVGDQFTEKNRGLVTTVFQVFYFIINFGSFFATLLTPVLYSQFGPEVAFGVPGIFMGIATIVFWLGRNRFVRVPPKPGGKLGALDFSSAVLLFSPVIALICAVFIVGDHFEPPPLVEGTAGFAWYGTYVSEYLSFLAMETWWFFALALVAFVVGLLIFQRRQRIQEDAGFLAVVLHAWRNRGKRRAGEGFFAPAVTKFGAEAAEGPPAVLRIILVFSMVSVFWALFDQHASTWVEQARQMDRSLTMPAATLTYVVGATVALALYGGTWLVLWISNIALPRRLHLGVLGVAAAGLVAALLYDAAAGVETTIELAAAQIQALNPLMVMIIIPLLNVAVYGPLRKRGIEVKPLQKMTVGMFLAAAAFGVAAVLQARIEAAGEGQVHVLWQVAQYVVMTTSEVLVSVTGLEFAYTQAPRSMKSTIMGFWLLGVTFGNVLVAFLAPVQSIFELSGFFWLFTVLAAVAAVVFGILAYFYKGKTYLQGA